MMRTIAVTSGKGGVGKTSLAANIGLALAASGRRVVVLDGDLGLATLDIVLGAKAPFTLQHVVAGVKTLSEVVTWAPGNLGFIGGGSAIHSLTHAGPKRMGIFLSQLEDLAATTDYLFFDTGSGIDNKVLHLLAAAQQTLLVATPDPASIADAYAVAKLLYRKVPDACIDVIVNQVQSDEEGRGVFQVLDQIAEQFLNKDLSYIGHVHADPQVLRAVRTRVPFMRVAPSCRAAGDVRAIARRIEAQRLGDSRSNLADRLFAAAA